MDRLKLMEAVLLSLVGGILGVGLGVLSFTLVVKLMGWSVLVTSYSIILSFAFATVICIFFGWCPARKAANLIPMDALRYE